MHGTGPLRRRRHRRSWQRACTVGLGLLVLVLTLELVYRLVALPPDYREQRLAALSESTEATAVPPADLAAELALVEPASGGPALEPGLRLERRLVAPARREVARLAIDPILAAGRASPATPFGTFADPALAAAAAVPSATADPAPAYEGSAALVNLPLPPVRPPAADQRRREPLVAIVIDDMGYSPASLGRLARLPGPLTLAFLPYADATGSMLRAARRGDFEIMLHMPMQPLGDADPGPEALLVGLSAEELRRRVRWAIDRVPGAVGVNNHMGSRFTADAEGLAVVMEEFRRHGLYFLDSRTNAQSQAERTARAVGLPASRRNVFIDHDPDPRAIAQQLALIERVAQRHGTVVAIGHPYPTTLAALESWLPSLERRGFRLARVSEVIAQRLCGEGRRADDCGPHVVLVGGDATVLPQEADEAAP
jgi:uncharacterized protein